MTDDRSKWICRSCDTHGDGRPFTTTQNCFKHFRSGTHCEKVAATYKAGDALDDALETGKDSAFAMNLASSIVDDAIVTCARKSLSLNSVPTVLNVVARALIACRGPNVFDSEVINGVRKKYPEAATALCRLNESTKSVNTKGGRRAACRRSRSGVTKRMIELAQSTLAQKIEFLLTCGFLSLSCDESDTFSSTAPMAVALQGCSTTFVWGLLFMGQTDVATAKTGTAACAALRKMLDQMDERLFEMIKSMCTDGASAMRSTQLYAGLDSNPAGSSMHAVLKRAGKPNLPNTHCLSHQLNLSLKRALSVSGVWTDQWLSHIKAIFNWFSNSPARKAQLKLLHKEMELLREFVTWRMVFPKYVCAHPTKNKHVSLLLVVNYYPHHTVRYYCPTRWLGIHRAVVAILSACDLLEEYSDQLVRDGFRPAREPIEIVLPAVAERARVGEEDIEGGDDDLDTRVSAATFYEWGTNPWDLYFDEPTEDVTIVDETTRCVLDVMPACLSVRLVATHH